MIPTPWLTKINAIINSLVLGETYDEAAIKKIKHMFICTFPYISRDLTTEEKEIVSGLMMIPSWLGGMGRE
jgi:hypothetical protein